jgi:hypothetical protein
MQQFSSTITDQKEHEANISFGSDLVEPQFLEAFHFMCV